MMLPSLPPPSSTALFLDFDGTLVEIAAHPEAITIAPATKEALRVLFEAMGGALAIITGREIAAVDRFLAPLHLPVAGIHGLTRRDAGGNVRLPPDNRAFLDAAEARLSQLAAAESGLLIERKAGSIALHYRARPDLEDRCLEILGEVAVAFAGIEIKRGKMVVEGKPGSANKGSAVMDFMAEPPFRGRHALFAGDDVTDEDAFRAVNAMGGTSIKIGDGPTSATYRAESTAAFIRWLETSARSISKGGAR